MINTNNASLKDTGKNTNAPFGTNNFSLQDAASFLGRLRPGTDWNNGSNYWADEDYELWHLAMTANMQGATGGVNNFVRNLQNGSSQNINFKWFSPSSSTYRLYFYYDNTSYYVNGGLAGVKQQGQFADVTVTAGNYIQASQPIALYNISINQIETAFSGWSGYKFASRVDRYQPNTFYVFASLDQVKNINVYGVSTFDFPINNALAPIHTTTNLGMYSMWTFNSTTSIQGILIEASEPICVVAAGSSNRDFRRLYPMTNNDKFGVFSGGGHIASVANYENGSVTATLVGYSSNSTQTTNFSAAFNPQNPGGYCYYHDSSGNPNGGTQFQGPAVRLIDTTGKSLFSAESQGDGDGSEMTAFVDFNFMQGRNWCYLPAASDWGGVIATQATGNHYVHQWSSATWKTKSWRFTQVNSLQDIQYCYMTGMVNSTNAPPLFESEAEHNVFYWDKGGQYEDNQFASDGTDFTKGTPAQWPTINYQFAPFGTTFNALDPWIQEICNGAGATTQPYGDGGDAATSQYMYDDVLQANFPLQFGNQTIFFVQTPGGGNPVYQIQNGDANNDVLLYEHTQVGICEGGGGKSDRRLKENITQIDVSPSGIPVYTFSYIGENDLYKGVMAQDLLELGFEDAVGMGDDGYYFVRYNMIDVNMEKIK